ncbi:thiamine pyrophosphate-binding protein [Paenibacillus sonchi]|uniref:thiamine pyrophosphate-binding protein n=1 Tax=Paenibacillus sonchi TaxID=373687 RepID=UPI002D802C72|nr:thiamine pyrophosphate-binding protein [Paenibacillus sonchi]
MAEALRNLGVTHSFGIIGKSICPVVLKMVDYGIEFIPGRHESSSGFEAAGYALKTGKLGVAFGTSGPGVPIFSPPQHMPRRIIFPYFL